MFSRLISVELIIDWLVFIPLYQVDDRLRMWLLFCWIKKLLINLSMSLRLKFCVKWRGCLTASLAARSANSLPGIWVRIRMISGNLLIRIFLILNMWVRFNYRMHCDVSVSIVKIPWRVWFQSAVYVWDFCVCVI